MINGCGESGNDKEHDTNKKSKGGGDQFGLAIVRIAVAQICEAAGFQNFQQSALEALSDIAIRYLRELGNKSHSFANLAGRTETNVFDIIQGLEDLGSAHGFPGASDVTRCSTSSGIVKEVIQFVNYTDEIPLIRPVPYFPVIKCRKPTPSFLHIGQTPIGENIPNWLPAFPDPSTYNNSPLPNERGNESRVDRVEDTRHNRKAQWSLSNLQQRLACNGSAANTLAEHGDATKAKRAAESNPFLALPIQSDEKDVPSVALPDKVPNLRVTDKNGDLTLGLIPPAIEASRERVCVSGDFDRQVLPLKRPHVHFKLGPAKKSLHMPSDLSLQNQDPGTTASWFPTDDEIHDKDEKKLKVELIVKETTENLQKLA